MKGWPFRPAVELVSTMEPPSPWATMIGTVARIDQVGEIEDGRLLVVAHGNSLRALVMYLENIPESEIVDLNIPTGVPLVMELDDDLRFLGHHYLGDPARIEQAIHGAAGTGGAKP